MTVSFKSLLNPKYIHKHFYSTLKLAPAYPTAADINFEQYLTLSLTLNTIIISAKILFWFLYTIFFLFIEVNLDADSGSGFFIITIQVLQN